MRYTILLETIRSLLLDQGMALKTFLKEMDVCEPTFYKWCKDEHGWKEKTKYVKRANDILRKDLVALLDKGGIPFPLEKKNMMQATHYPEGSFGHALATYCRREKISLLDLSLQCGLPKQHLFVAANCRGKLSQLGYSKLVELDAPMFTDFKPWSFLPPNKQIDVMLRDLIRACRKTQEQIEIDWYHLDTLADQVRYAKGELELKMPIMVEPTLSKLRVKPNEKARTTQAKYRLRREIQHRLGNRKRYPLDLSHFQRMKDRFRVKPGTQWPDQIWLYPEVYEDFIRFGYVDGREEHASVAIAEDYEAALAYKP
jgi:hypothetical protein